MVKISIVTISYNQVQFLPRCVASIEGQIYSDYEHIVVDPGSTDGSREWLGSHTHPRMRVVTKSDKSPAEGLNNGLNAVGGELFMYLNADDELAPNALAEIAEMHDQLPNVDVVIGNGWTIDSDGLPLRYIKSDRFSVARYLLDVGTVLQQSTVFKTRVFQNGLQFNESNRYSWDIELLIDAKELGAVIRNVPRTWGYFRLHGGSITMSSEYRRVLRLEHLRLTKELTKLPAWSLKMASYPARLCKKTTNLVVKAGAVAPFPGLVTGPRVETK